MSDFIRKEHNVSLLLYHIVCPAKYRRAVFTSVVDEKLKEVCEEISWRYEIEFLEIGRDQDHVHFLVQSVPKYSPKKIVQTTWEPHGQRNLAASCRKSKNSCGAGNSGRMGISSAPSAHMATRRRSSNISKSRVGRVKPVNSTFSDTAQLAARSFHFHLDKD